MGQTKTELSKMKKDELIIKLMESEKEREKLESFGIHKIEEVKILEDKVKSLTFDVNLGNDVIDRHDKNFKELESNLSKLRKEHEDLEKAAYHYRTKVNEALSGINLLTEAGQGFYIENNINF